MAWQENTGSRRIEDSLTHKDYIITFIGVAGTDDLIANIPAIGDKYAGVTGAGTLESTDVATEPEAVQISEVAKITELSCQVTVRFRGFHVE